MPYSLSSTNLLSRRIRVNTAAGRSGANMLAVAPAPAGLRLVRQIDKLGYLGSKDSGLLSILWNTGKTLVGWASSVIGFVSWSVVGIYGFLLAGVEQLKAFNWNATDKQLLAAQRTQRVQLASIWGGVAGSSFGWLASVAVGAGIGLVCPVVGGAALAVSVATAVGREGIDEVAANFDNAMRQTARILLNNASTSLFINYRKLWKSAPLPLLEAIYGKETAKFIKEEWGNDGGPVLSFNKVMDEAVESISDPAAQAFAEEFLEEAWDSFVEGGFIIASELDSAFHQAKLANSAQLGESRTVVLEPDREAESEKLVFQNIPQKLLIPTLQQTINTHRMLYNRDVGQVIGQPTDDYLKANPQSLRITIKLFSVQFPPFVDRGFGRFVEAQITIPDVKRSALDWSKIKAAVGGRNGYMWGRFKATANLNNGRQLACYGGSKQEAEERVRACLTLSNAEILTINVTEEVKEGERQINESLYKESTRIYPAYFTILNREKILSKTQGKPSRRGNYRDKGSRILLWTDEKPEDFEQIVTELLKTPVS